LAEAYKKISLNSNIGNNLGVTPGAIIGEIDEDLANVLFI